MKNILSFIGKDGAIAKYKKGDKISNILRRKGEYAYKYITSMGFSEDNLIADDKGYDTRLFITSSQSIAHNDFWGPIWNDDACVLGWDLEVNFKTEVVWDDSIKELIRTDLKDKGYVESFDCYEDEMLFGFKTKDYSGLVIHFEDNALRIFINNEASGED